MSHFVFLLSDANIRGILVVCFALMSSRVWNNIAGEKQMSPLYFLYSFTL